jgi:ankyrin repeat protein
MDNMAILLKYGTDINKPDLCGDTAILLAGMLSDFELVAFLIEHGADYKVTFCKADKG